MFRWVRHDSIQLVADSVRAYLLDFANGLWTEAYALHGDPTLTGVEAEGFRYLKRHLGWAESDA